MTGPTPSGWRKRPVDKDFFRFPSTPHIQWLGAELPRDDKLLTAQEVKLLFSSEVQIEEKIDGANLGISFDKDGNIQAQNRGQYLLKPYMGQFENLEVWLAARENELFDLLGEHLILFGEWCAAKHSIGYEQLPDWFLVFDVFDRHTEMFWSTSRRNRLAKKMGLKVVPQVWQGRTQIKQVLKRLETQKSAFTDEWVEGFIIRKENADWLEMRGKIVRAEFVQNIGVHWSKQKLEWNQIDWASTYDCL